MFHGIAKEKIINIVMRIGVSADVIYSEEPNQKRNGNKVKKMADKTIISKSMNNERLLHTIITALDHYEMYWEELVMRGFRHGVYWSRDELSAFESIKGEIRQSKQFVKDRLT